MNGKGIESVEALVEPEEVASPKQKLYRSKFAGNLPPTGSTFGLHSTSAKVSDV